MPDPHAERENDSPSTANNKQPVEYPENRMVGVIDGLEQLRAAVEALTTGGFLSSEIEIHHGAAAAEKLRKETGRTGLANLAMRLVESIGMPNDETVLKNNYADALADGRFLIAVLAPTEERQQSAATLLRAHGGKHLNFFSRYTITSPRAD